MAKVFDTKDAINGTEGEAFATIDGQRYSLFSAKKIESTIEKEKEDIKRLGSRMVGHKSGVMTGSGTMTIHYGSPAFRKMVKDYKKTGRDIYFDMQVMNDDPESSAGRQVVILKACNINSVTLALLDVDSNALEEEVEFTFDDFEIPEEFSVLPGTNI